MEFRLTCEGSASSRLLRHCSAGIEAASRPRGCGDCITKGWMRGIACWAAHLLGNGGRRAGAIPCMLSYCPEPVSKVLRGFLVRAY
jgi:hypothetical protein